MHGETSGRGPGSLSLTLSKVHTNWNEKQNLIKGRVLFFHPAFLQKSVMASTLERAAQRHMKAQSNHGQTLLPPEMCFVQRDSVFVPPGAKQSSSSLLDCFFQINIFPKDLNPKQQP